MFFQRLLSLGLLAALLTACGEPSPLNTQQTLDDVNIYLSNGECSAALEELQPIYNSASTDNDVRMAMASVYACFSGLNMFKLASDLTGTNTATLGFPWSFFATEFPSVANDKKVESAGLGLDALMAALNPGQVLLPPDLFNTTTNNEGSVLASDRTSDANFYMFFLTMAALGGEENRQGANASGSPTNATPLPWVNSTTSGITTDGCAYASALVNFADAMAVMPTTGYLGNALNTFNNFVQNFNVPGVGSIGVSFTQLIYDACMDGCQNKIPPQLGGTNEDSALNSKGGWVATCGSNTGCTSCPLLLRNRNNCAGTTNDEVSCAAAGVINFINNSVIGWQ